jgi:hypothetical protein
VVYETLWTSKFRKLRLGLFVAIVTFCDIAILHHADTFSEEMMLGLFYGVLITKLIARGMAVERPY